MKERSWGRIVNMASVAGTLGGFGQASYSATKAGLLGLTKTLAMEGGRHGITANAIVPGSIGTEAFHMANAAMNERIANRTVFKRPAVSRRTSRTRSRSSAPISPRTSPASSSMCRAASNCSFSDPGYHRRMKRAAAWAGLTVLVSLVAIGFVFAGSAGKLASDTHIAGVDVGGMTPKAARDLLERRAAALADVPVTFTADGRHGSGLRARGRRRAPTHGARAPALPPRPVLRGLRGVARLQAPRPAALPDRLGAEG
jgi:hypothetical protein